MGAVIYPDQKVVDYDLSGRRALVTGAASGIGLACARRLADAGATVIVADRDEVVAERVAEELDGELWVVDLGEIESLREIDLDVDILVNNAGFQHIAPIVEFPAEVFSAMLRVMVEAPFLLTKAVLPKMYERQFGRIINISSHLGVRAAPFKSAYTTA
jgi:3-hydroxybutyrate dehydrogenase